MTIQKSLQSSLLIHLIKTIEKIWILLFYKYSNNFSLQSITLKKNIKQGFIQTERVPNINKMIKTMLANIRYQEKKH